MAKWNSSKEMKIVPLTIKKCNVIYHTNKQENMIISTEAKKASDIIQYLLLIF